MQISGLVHKIDAPQTREYNGKEYTSQKIYIDTTDYSKEKVWENFPAFEFSGNSCNDLMGVNSGDVVTIQFEINGRFYQKNGEERHFNTVRAWKIEVNERVEIKGIPDNELAQLKQNIRSEVEAIDDLPW